MISGGLTGPEGPASRRRLLPAPLRRHGVPPLATGLLVLCLLARIVPPLAADPSPASSPPEDLPAPYAFALHLMEEGDWEQAAREFDRFVFLQPDHPLATRALFLLGRCREEGGRYAEAVERYRQVQARDPGGPLAREAGYRIGVAGYRAGRFEEARAALARFAAQGPEDPWTWRARYRAAWAAVRLHRFVAARDAFAGLADRDNPYREPAERMRAAVEEIGGLPYRSPVLAGLLAGILPGAGHLYAGAAKDGLLSFLVNGALIAASVEAWQKEVYGVAGVVSFVGLSFYLGNIYGAVNSAHHANRERLEGHLRRCEAAYEWWGEAPGEAWRAGGNTAGEGTGPGTPRAGSPGMPGGDEGR